MTGKKIQIVGYLAYISAVLFSGNILAQEVENQLQFRSSAAFSKEIVPDLKIEVEPELRWRYTEGFDRFQFNSQLEYEPIKYAEVFAGYRLIGDKNKDDETEYYHRYQFGAKGKIKLSDFKPSLRLMYTDYADDEESDDGDKFLRYKISLEYNIPKCKLTPEIAFEGFYQLADNAIYKYRYKVGFDYKLSKKLKLSTSYKFDYFMTDYKNRHIIDIGLKVKL